MSFIFHVDWLNFKIILTTSISNAWYSHFDGLVPVDDVAGERKRLDVDYVHVTALRAHVDPLGGQRQVEARDPAGEGGVSASVASKGGGGTYQIGSKEHRRATVHEFST